MGKLMEQPRHHADPPNSVVDPAAGAAHTAVAEAAAARQVRTGMAQMAEMAAPLARAAAAAAARITDRPVKPTKRQDLGMAAMDAAEPAAAYPEATIPAMMRLPVQAAAAADLAQAPDLGPDSARLMMFTEMGFMDRAAAAAAADSPDTQALQTAPAAATAAALALAAGQIVIMGVRMDRKPMA